MYQLASYTLLAFFLSSVSAASELASCAHDDLACNLGTDADGILEQGSGLLLASGRKLNDATQCGVWMEDTDIKGDNLVAGGEATDSDQECVDLCQKKEGCNASIRIPNGKCFVKSEDPVEAFARIGPKSFIHCAPGADAGDSGTGNGDSGSTVTCGTILTNMDIPGENKVLGVDVKGQDSDSNQECFDICATTDGCNASIRVPNGKCYLKTVPADVVPTTKSGFTAFLQCSPGAAPTDAETGTGDSESTATCGTILTDMDIPGENKVLGVNVKGQDTDSNQDCFDLCATTDGCNASIRVPNGKCYLKTVPTDVVPTTKSGFTAFLQCSAGVSAGTSNPTQTTQCGTFLEDTNIPGANLNYKGTYVISDVACQDLCSTYDTCNAWTRVANGKCYLKSVADDVVAESKSGATGYLNCKDGVIATTPPPEGPTCGQFLYDTDVVGDDIEVESATSDQKCLDLCSAHATCNACVRLEKNNKCYMKTVADDFKTKALTGATGFVICEKDTPAPTPPVYSPTLPDASLDEIDNLKAYFKNDMCPNTVTTVQWTGKAVSVIGVPGGIQDLYADYGGSNYNPNTKKYTLDFNDLPASLTYCSEEKEYATECNLPMAQQGSGTNAKWVWTFNPSTKLCEQFKYKGQGGNDNRFDSQALCATACETPIKGTMGGQVFFQDEDNNCVLPPTKANGSPCCEMKVWQPNYAGFYYDNCSAKFDLGGDGLYFFKTELPGSEESAKWGPDPEAHIHYDIVCSGCNDGNKVFGTDTYHYWNKFYPEDICTLDKCWGNAAGNGNAAKKAGPHHQADKKVIDGVNYYTYDMLLPKD